MQSSGPILCRNISKFLTIHVGERVNARTISRCKECLPLEWLLQQKILPSSCSCKGHCIAYGMCQCAHCAAMLENFLSISFRTWTALSSQHRVRAWREGARKTDRSDGKAAREKGKKFRAPLPSSFQFPLTRETFYPRINMLYFSMLNAFTMVLRATVTLSVCERYTTAWWWFLLRLRFVTLTMARRLVRISSPKCVSIFTRTLNPIDYNTRVKRMVIWWSC